VPQPDSIGITVHNDPVGDFFRSGSALLVNHFDLGQVETELRVEILRAFAPGSRSLTSATNAVTSQRFRDVVKWRGVHLLTDRAVSAEEGLQSMRRPNG